MSLVEDVKLYRKHALLNYIRKDKVATEYLKTTPPNQLDEEVLERFYRVHQALNSKLIMIKLGKGIVKQSCLFAKSKFEQKLSFLKYITPENINVDVTDEEYLALIQQINSSKTQGSNLYLIVGKNIIIGLLNINLDHFNNALGGETITEEQLRELTKHLSGDNKTNTSSIPVPETPPPVPETSFGQQFSKKRTLDINEMENVNVEPKLKLQKLDVDESSDFEESQFNVNFNEDLISEIDPEITNEMTTSNNITSNTSTLNTSDLDSNFNDVASNSSIDEDDENDDESDVEDVTEPEPEPEPVPVAETKQVDVRDAETKPLNTLVSDSVQNNMIIYDPAINIQSEPPNDSEKLEDLLTKLNSEFDDVAETVNDVVDVESPPMNVESLLRMVKEKKVRKNTDSKEKLGKLQFKFE